MLGTGDLEWLRLLGAKVRAGSGRGAPGRGSGGTSPPLVGLLPTDRGSPGARIKG